MDTGINVNDIDVRKRVRWGRGFKKGDNYRASIASRRLRSRFTGRSGGRFYNWFAGERRG
jgi:hypothetical protein